jgi:DNA-binding beta-propeller fold protein YncE
MCRFCPALIVALAATAAFSAGSASPARSQAQQAASLRPIMTIPLPNVAGRIDHLAFDAARHYLFVAALGNNTIEVLDTAKNAHVRSVPGFHEPQGLAVVPELNTVAVANGETGTLQSIDAQTFQTRWTVSISGDADNVRYDGGAKRLYVAAEGGLYAVDPASGKSVGRIAIEGHPESFQLDPMGTAIFANLPGLLSAQLLATDRKEMRVSARWTPGCAGNYPLAFDVQTSRLFVGCRRPARLAMIDSRSGKSLASVEIVGDTDDLFFDAARQRLYVIGGDGYIDIIGRKGDALARMARTPTRGGARTGLWVPSLNRLYVAVPARSGQPAEIRVFESAS